jgi:hypothetical protein
MPAPGNLSFETPAEQPGLAEGWTLTSLSAAYEKAGFGAAAFVSVGADWTDVTGIGQLGRFVPEVVAPNGFFSFVMETIATAASLAYDPGIEHNLVYFDASNRLFYDVSTQQIILRIGGVNLLSAPLTWTASTVMTFTAKHLATGRTLSVAGAASGNGTVTAAAKTAMVGMPRVGYVLGLPGVVETEWGVYSWIAQRDQIDVEDFERRWGNFYYDLEPYALALGSASFGALLFEGFEVDWDDFLRGLAATAEASFDSDPGPARSYEDFEQLGPYALDFPGVEAAVFGIESFDPLGWDEGYTLGLFAVETALFAGTNADPAEGFERVFGPVAVAVSPAPASELGWEGHPFFADDRCGFSTSGAFPLGISDGILFYVVNPTTLGFQISQALGGAVIVIGDYGSGQLKVFGDPSLFWVDVI